MSRRTYGEGSVHQRASDGRWVGSVEGGITERGTRRRVYVYGKSEAEASKKLTRKRAELERAQGTSTAPDAGRKTVHSWGGQWLSLRVEKVRPKTYEANVTAVRKFIDPTIGRKRLLDITAADVRLVDAKVRQHGNEDYVKKVRTALFTMLRDAIAEGYSVPTNIFEASKSRGHAVRTKPKRQALEMPHAVALLGEAAQHPDYARWVTGFYQGQRQGQTLGLTWDDGVDMERGLVTLSWQLQPLPYLDKQNRSAGFRVPIGFEKRPLAGRFHLVRPKTDAAWRVTPMTEALYDALLVWREAWPENDHGLIWARTNGWPIDKADDADRFRELQRAAGVRKGQVLNQKTGELEDDLYTGHEMRNTCATILVTAGVDPATITAILGHSSWSTSLSYATSQLEHMRAALRGVNAAYRPEELQALA